MRCQLCVLAGGRFALVHEGTQRVVLRAYKKGLLRPTFRIALCGTACVYPRGDARVSHRIGDDGSISKLHAMPTGDACVRAAGGRARFRARTTLEARAFSLSLSQGTRSTTWATSPRAPRAR